MKFKAFYYPGLLFFLIVLSHASSYKIPDLSNIPLSSVLFLTPYAIIKNFILGNTDIYFAQAPLRYENMLKNIALYIPVLVCSYLIIFKRGNE